jgi:glycosyltransferase involved in cell wall biosynthesis
MAREESARARRVLVLAYRFPPQGGGGIQRTLKFVKHLRRYGWQPVVHTVSNPYNRLRDESLLAEIPPDVPVYRTATFEVEHLEASISALRDRLRRPRRGKPQGRQAAEHSSPDDGSDALGEREARLKRGGRFAKLQDALWSRILVPDPQIAWFPAAFLRSLSIIRQEGIAAIYSSTPPHSGQVLALALQRRTGLPWIADLRDVWTEALHRRQWYVGNARRQQREERWERAMCERADRVITTSDFAREVTLRKHPDCPPEKVTVITNGFDPDDFAHTSAEPRLLEPGLLHITLTGSVETMFDLMPLFSAVDELVRGEGKARALLRLNFIGTKRQPRYDAFIAERGLSDVIRFYGYVPHADALQYVAESQVSMIAMAERHDSSGVKLAAKMFEYMYLRKPVLALIIPGMTTKLLERTGLGITVTPDDPAAIRKALGRLLEQFLGEGLRVVPDERVIAGYDRRLQAERLAGILDDAVARSRRHAG